MTEFLRPFNNCPSCESPTSKSHQLFNVTLLGEICSVLECGICGLIYKELSPTINGFAKIYSDNYEHFIADSPIELAELNSQKRKLSLCNKLLNKSLYCNEIENIKLLDIGCGRGIFVEIARSLGYLAEGIDSYLPDTLQNNYLKKKSPELVPANSYHIATLLNVAEHLDQPRAMFSAVRQLLKSNGVMLLTCPYGGSLARHFYQNQWNHLVLDEHLLFWTPRSLTYLLRELGFQGKVTYRIAGSPFPQGKRHLQTALEGSDRDRQLQHYSPMKPRKFSFTPQIWKLGRIIQRQEATANLVRKIIHFTHLGDYLEYAISVGEK